MQPEIPSTELITQHGFPTYVAVVLLIGFIAAFGFLFRWFFNTQTKSIDSLTNAVKLLVISNTNLQKQLLAHDLTVSGLNPSTGKTPEDRDSKAYAKYRDIEKGINELIEEVRRL